MNRTMWMPLPSLLSMLVFGPHGLAHVREDTERPAPYIDASRPNTYPTRTLLSMPRIEPQIRSKMTRRDLIRAGSVAALSLASPRGDGMALLPARNSDL